MLGTACPLSFLVPHSLSSTVLYRNSLSMKTGTGQVFTVVEDRNPANARLHTVPAHG
jgi:hypothetical protein